MHGETLKYFCVTVMHKALHNSLRKTVTLQN